MSYRSEVGPEKLYDFIGAQQFCVMFHLGLREHHKLVDFGCGSLRGGRLFIPYLLPGNYYGVEPKEELIREGIQNELGASIVAVKRPHFYTFNDFRMGRLDIDADFILAQSVLSHAGYDVLETILKEASSILAKNGMFAATFFEGPLRKKKGWLGHDISSYPMNYMRRAGKKAGLEMNALSEIVPGVNHPVGQKWIVFSR